jgi:hypothetical protein
MPTGITCVQVFLNKKLALAFAVNITLHNILVVANDLEK